MREENMNLEEQNEQLEETTNETKGKKKQKAPMGIRPNDYVEEKFKEMASEAGITQTRLFERIFMEYTSRAREELKEQSLDCSIELNSLDGAVVALVDSIKGIVNKAQVSVINKNNEMKSFKETIDKKIELANIDLENKVKELEEKNRKLEMDLANSVKVINGFDAIKEDLENKNSELKASLDKKDEEITELKEGIKERDKALKTLEKEMDNAAKEVSNIEKEIALLKEEKNRLAGNLSSVQANNQILQDTINNFNSMKVAEIEAIKSNESNMSAIKISSIEAIKNAEIEKLNLKIASLEESIKVLEEKNENSKGSYNELKEIKDREIIAIKESESSTYSLKVRDLENKYKAEIDDLNVKIKDLENVLSALEKKNKKKEKTE